MSLIGRPNQRERILDVALRLMSERGASGVSMRQLANACGIQVAAIYHYFDSKDALLAAVIDERRYAVRLAEVPVIDRRWSVERRLRAVAGAVWTGALDEEAVWRLLLGEAVRGEAAALPVGRELLDTIRTGFGAWIADSVPEVDPAVATEVLIGQMLGGFVRRFFEPDTPAADIGADWIDVFVRAVLRS